MEKLFVCNYHLVGNCKERVKIGSQKELIKFAEFNKNSIVINFTRELRDYEYEALIK